MTAPRIKLDQGPVVLRWYDRAGPARTKTFPELSEAVSYAVVELANQTAEITAEEGVLAWPELVALHAEIRRGKSVDL